MAAVIRDEALACRDRFNEAFAQLVSLAPSITHTGDYSRSSNDHVKETSNAPLFTILQNQLARFNIWAANTGVFTRSRLSLDYRLRDVLEIREILVDLVHSLTENLDQLKSNIGQLIALNKIADPDPDNGGKASAAELTDDIRVILRFVADTIGRLNRLSNAIFRAGSANRDARASDFVWRDEEGNDIGPAWRDNFAFQLCERKFPKAPKHIQQRLANAMYLRRKRLLYRQERQEKLRLDTNKGPRPQKESENSIRPITDIPIPVALKFEPGQSPVQDSDKSLQRAPRSAVTFNTAATPLDHNKIQISFAPSRASSIRSVPLDDQTKARFPVPPRFSDSEEESGEAICPYCGLILFPRDITNVHRWQRHVLQDLDPYVCLVDPCSRGEELFGTLTEWFKHTREEHRLQWSCMSRSHKGTSRPSFQSKDAFQNHMRQEHRGSFIESDLSVLAESIARPVGPTFDFCPLCDLPGIENMDHGTGRSTSALDQHIGNHLVLLALQSIPWIEGDDDAPSETSATHPDTRQTVREEFENEFFEFDTFPDYSQQPPLDESSTYTPEILNVQTTRQDEWGALLEPALNDDHDPILMALSQQKGEKISIRLLKFNDDGMICLEGHFAHNLPPYAILSHTWGADTDEVTFEDMINGTGKDKPGFKKIHFCGEQARQDGLQYFWVDTCCIDKTNPVEHEEAINSMFQWYSNASICYAYLSDVPPGNQLGPSSKFFVSRWFTRGWTLQELLAPKHVQFYDSGWHYHGDKRYMSAEIEQITGIPRTILSGEEELHDASIAQRMSWASRRITKRREDIAYCLLGIFGITMPIIYGEGDQAFSRLQKEILKKHRDDSILAWGLTLTKSTPDTSVDKRSAGVMAASPSDFANCGDIATRECAIGSINPSDIDDGYIQLNFPLFTASTGEIFGLLNCGPKHNTGLVVGIPLSPARTSEASEEYVRLEGHYSVLLPKIESGSSTQTIYIQAMPQHNKMSPVNRHNWFYIEEPIETGLKLIEVEPPERWWKADGMIVTVNDSVDNIVQRTWTRFRPEGEWSRDFLVLLEFEIQQSQVQARCHVMVSSRDTTLKDLAEGLVLMREEALGKQSASDGTLSIRVTVEKDTIAGEPVFLVRVAKTDSLTDGTVDATSELQQLGAGTLDKGSQMIGGTFYIKALIKKAYVLYNNCKMAPEEIRLAINHINSLILTLEAADSDIISNRKSFFHGTSDVARAQTHNLKWHIKHCDRALTRIESLLRKYHQFREVRRWDSFRWSEAGKAEIAFAKEGVVMASIDLDIFLTRQGLSVLWKRESTREAFNKRVERLEQLKPANGGLRAKGSSRMGCMIIVSLVIARFLKILKNIRMRKMARTGILQPRKQGPDFYHLPSDNVSNPPHPLRRSSSLSRLLGKINEIQPEKPTEHFECWKVGGISALVRPGVESYVLYKRGQMQLREIVSVLRDASRCDLRGLSKQDKTVKLILERKNDQEKRVKDGTGRRWYFVTGRPFSRDLGKSGTIIMEKAIVILARR